MALYLGSKKVAPTKSLGSNFYYTKSQIDQMIGELNSGKADKAPAITTVDNASGTVALTDNSNYVINIAGNITFTLPTVTDATVLHRIEIELNMPTVYTIDLGLGNSPLYYNKTTPDLSAAGTYNLLFQYSPTESAWYCGGAVIGAA